MTQDILEKKLNLIMDYTKYLQEAIQKAAEKYKMYYPKENIEGAMRLSSLLYEIEKFRAKHAVLCTIEEFSDYDQFMSPNFWGELKETYCLTDSEISIGKMICFIGKIAEQYEDPTEIMQKSIEIQDIFIKGTLNIDDEELENFVLKLQEIKDFSKEVLSDKSIESLSKKIEKLNMELFNEIYPRD